MEGLKGWNPPVAGIYGRKYAFVADTFSEIEGTASIQILKSATNPSHHAFAELLNPKCIVVFCFVN